MGGKLPFAGLASGCAGQAFAFMGRVRPSGGLLLYRPDFARLASLRDLGPLDRMVGSISGRYGNTRSRADDYVGRSLATALESRH